MYIYKYLQHTIRVSSWTWFAKPLTQLQLDLNSDWNFQPKPKPKKKNICCRKLNLLAGWTGSTRSNYTFNLKGDNS